MYSQRWTGAKTSARAELLPSLPSGIDATTAACGDAEGLGVASGAAPTGSEGLEDELTAVEAGGGDAKGIAGVQPTSRQAASVA